jgi:hypothetical protein
LSAGGGGVGFGGVLKTSSSGTELVFASLDPSASNGFAGGGGGASPANGSKLGAGGGGGGGGTNESGVGSVGGAGGV